MGKPVLPLDRYFIDALKTGLPRCSGVALGLDRLIMLALEKRSIAEVIAFPWDRA
jgi:lysyl-tRNA synthetase class 2